MRQLCGRIDDLVRAHPDRRVIVGIAGLPGSGKTTFAEALVAALLRWPADWAGHRSDEITDDDRPWIGSHVAHVPMDGFHLADVELERLGRAGRKGAPDTFDAAGYAALLARLRHSDDTVWAPAFDRAIEQPIAGSTPVLRSTRVVITEGNYLLLDEPGWPEARSHLDTVWFYDLLESVRRRRLIDRHIEFGKPPDVAVAWVDGPDQHNADLIAGTRDRADLIVYDSGDGPSAITVKPRSDVPRRGAAPAPTARSSEPTR